MLITGFMELASQDLHRGLEGIKTFQSLMYDLMPLRFGVVYFCTPFHNTLTPTMASVPDSGHGDLARHTW